MKHSLVSYILGFIFSLALTFVAYFFAVDKILTGDLLIATLLGLALTQLLVQITFFLHIWKGENSKWNLVMVFSTIGVIFIVIVGAIWIMRDLNYRHANVKSVEFILKDEGINK